MRMKGWTVGWIVFLCATTLQAQSKNEKKDVGTALAWTFLVPGAGQVYAGRADYGIMHAVLTGATTVWMIRSFSSEQTEARTGPILMLAVLRLGDFVMAAKEVEKWNTEIDAQIGANGLMLGVRIHL